jgi:hypothetical protein
MALVALAFEGIGWRRFQQRPGLAVAQRGRLALIVLGFGAFDPADRVMAHGIDLAQVVEKRSDRRKFSADGTRGEATLLEPRCSSSLRQAIRWARVTWRISSGRSTPAKAVKSCTSSR